MDDTHSSRTSDAAAATRKRRSSILKSQRPPRTPFSELEFNVATPTDTAKSRRVSFSRRTGVAEFVTNEATTTWKNFYEEHNKSLESSGNESGANAPRPIGHIGQRIFDQQFQEVEAVDFGSTLDNRPNRNTNMSINSGNFTQQLASLECTGDDRKLSVPQQNFEMSALTEHQSKLFADDLAVPTMGEMSGHIDVNFSVMQTLDEVKDDLDEIQKDLERAQCNVVCPGPFTGRRSLSEYIEVDLNTTHVAVKNDDDDMSITETIPSPKVQDVSKNHSSIRNDKKDNFSKDWVADRENIMLNPYITPKESKNFAVNDESDKVIVFDGKRLTIQSDKEADKFLKSNTSDMKPTVSKDTKGHQKNIVLNVNDDLPNFIDDPLMLTATSFKHSVIYDNGDDLTNGNKSTENRNTTHVNETGNISITQGIPSNIVESKNLSKTVVFDNIEADISMTQALPSKIIGFQESKTETQRRRTILYENDMGDVSITQAIPASIIMNENKQDNKHEPERRRTILDNDMSNISMTQAIPANIILNDNKEGNKQEPEKRRTILDNDMSNISMTRAIPTNIILNDNKEGHKQEPERRRTILFDNDMSNISMTQAIPANIILNENKQDNKHKPERRITILNDNDMSNISMTQAIPANIILNENKQDTKHETERRRTILDNDISNISMTQAIPANIILNDNKEGHKQEPERRRTILFDNDMSNISMTQAIPANIILNENKQDNKHEHEKRRTILFDNDMSNISMTQAIPANIILNDNEEGNKQEPARRRTILDNDMSNISMTQAIPANIILNDNKEANKQELERRRTILNNDMSNISMTQAVPVNIIINERKDFNKSKSILYENVGIDISITQPVSTNVLISHVNSKPESVKRKTIVFESEDGNTSVTRPLPPNILSEKQSEIERKSVFCDDNSLDHISSRSIHLNVNEKSKIDDEKTVECDHIAGNISITKTVPTSLTQPGIDVEEKTNNVSPQTDLGDISITAVTNEKRKTFIDEDGNVSFTRTRHSNILGGHKIPIYMPKVSRASQATNKDFNGENSVVTTEADLGAMSITDAVGAGTSFANATINNEKRKTIVYEDEAANISVTRILPSNILKADKSEISDKLKTILYESNAPNVSVKPAVLVNVVIVNNAVTKTQSVISEADTTLAKGNASNEESTISEVSNIHKNSEPNILSKNSSNEKCYIDAMSNMSDVRSQPRDLISEDNPTVDNRKSSSDGLIYIIRDIEEETQTDKTNDQIPNKSITCNNDIPKIQYSPLSLEYKEEADADVTDNLPNKLNELKNLVNDKHPQSNKHEMNTKRESDRLLERSLSHDKSEILSIKSFRNANDTNELLEMLSDLTDRRQSKEPEPVPDKKIEPSEQKRLSVAPSRLSTVFSREDLLNNISMAHAALQQPIEIDESINDTILDTPLEIPPAKTAGRLSNEVVKKLQFDDESASDGSIKSDIKTSPLKKTAFGEVSYLKDTKTDDIMTVSPLKKTAFDENSFVKEGKTNIIPNYFRDVSDDIKALMNDLVKPNADCIPFQVPPEVNAKKSLSTCSTQIQANLTTSSQIDSGSELESFKDSASDIEKASLVSGYPMQRSLSNRLNSSQECFIKQANSDSTSQDRVIVFDYGNPLNNVLLVPIEYSDVHKYNPHRSNETLSTFSQSIENRQLSGDNSNPRKSNETLSTASQSIDNKQLSRDTSEAQSVPSDASKPTYNDQSVSASTCELKDTEVNTVIVMKLNHELLKESSSITLVDDALVQDDVDIDSDKKSSLTNDRSDSPTKPLDHIVERDVFLSEMSTSDETMASIKKKSGKGKKRIYSPTKKNAQDSLDTTPKQSVKMMKLNSPKRKVRVASPEKLTAEKDDTPSQGMDVDEPSDANKSPKKRPKFKKPGTNVTVQQLLTKYDIHPNIDQDALNKQIIKALSRSESSTGQTVSLTEIESNYVDIVGSFTSTCTSSKNQNEMQEALAVKATESHALSSSSRSDKMELEPDAITSSNDKSECDASVNVVAKIDMLPFMGSYECEWDASGIDTWSFRLLHGRLRLHVRLAHRHDNATRTRVRADTPVLHVAVDATDNCLKSPVGTVGVGFALETMRYYVGRGCSTAGDVPTLLRRCAAVARLTMRWGRVMHEAWLHLAYTLKPDGSLTLKVANIPLRSVWEVTMRLELVFEAGRVPHPRACGVRVTRVLSDVRVSDTDVRRALADVPSDWGHVPRAVWKIFRHLKHKTLGDDVLGV